MITTNTGAKKIEGTDNWRQIFDAHNSSVDAHDETQSDLDYIIKGNSSSVSIAAGKFVSVRGSTITGVTDGIYTAAKAIPASTTLDSSYFTAVTGGALNALSDHIATKSTTLTSTASSLYRQNVRKSGNVVYVFVGINGGMTANTDFAVGTLPEGYRPNVIIQMPGIVTNGSTTTPLGNVFVIINTDGTIIINSTAVGYVAFAISFIV